MRWGMDLNILMVVATTPDINIKDLADKIGCSRVSTYRRVKVLSGEGWIAKKGWGNQKVCVIADEGRREILIKLHKIIYMQDEIMERNGIGDVK